MEENTDINVYIDDIDFSTKTKAELFLQNNNKNSLLDMGEIYLVQNIVNGKQYIGQAICVSSTGRRWGTRRRWGKHVSSAATEKKENYFLLSKAIKKYGKDSFTVRVIQVCKIENLNDWEGFFIKKYNTISPSGYNLLQEGQNGRKHHDETRNKMSETHRKRLKTQHKPNAFLAHRTMREENRTILYAALDKMGLDMLPMYVQYSRVKDKDIICVKIDGKQKSFTSREMLLTEKIRLAIEWKNSILQRSSV